MSRPAQPRETVADARLAWPVRRGGQDLEVSVAPPRRQGERGFRAVDVLGTPGMASEPGAVSERAAGLVRALTRATQVGSTVAIQGFAAARRAAAPLTFVLAISLTSEIAFPEAAQLPERNVTWMRLACGPGVRVQRLARTDAEADGPALTQFTATYLVQTDHGVLALAFATPHLDGAPEFALLFDAIARSCTVEAR